MLSITYYYHYYFTRSMEVIHPLVPETDHKLLTHIRRMNERRQKYKAKRMEEIEATKDGARRVRICVFVLILERWLRER